MKVLADENMPELENLLSNDIELIRCQGRKISQPMLQDVDALLVRSVTQITAPLLNNTKVKFVGSATIGTDHVDTDYLAQQGIHFAHAPYSSIEAVVDYTLAAMLHFSSLSQWQTKKVGIIGLGNIGSGLQKRLQHLKIEVIAYDPWVENATATWQQVLKCDALSFHVPLIREGKFPTYHMLDQASLAQLQADCLVINTSRGGVIDEQALMQHLQNHSQAVILDVFEHEPSPEKSLLKALFLATPHIAGYSEQAKLRGSIAVVSAFNRYFDTESTMVDLLSPTVKSLGEINSIAQFLQQALPLKKLSDGFVQGYLSAPTPADYFDWCRKNYPKRSEWGYLSSAPPESLFATMQSLGVLCRQ